MSLEIAQYAASVGAALADLPEHTRNELLEDLPAHLTEVAAEVAAEGGTLADRLGPPAAYAAELRSTLGHDAVLTPAARFAAATARIRGRLRSVDRRLGRIFRYATLSELGHQLRPAWWIARGYLAAMFIGVLLGNSWQNGLIPRLQGSEVGGVLLVAACVIGSVWFGQAAGQTSRLATRLTLGAVSAVLAVFALAAFTTADGALTRDQSYYPTATADVYYQQPSGDIVVLDQRGQVVAQLHPAPTEMPAPAGTPAPSGEPELSGSAVPSPAPHASSMG
jgi:hypothetical protein